MTSQTSNVFNVGAIVTDLVHNTKGVVKSVVLRPEDGHHDTFAVVALDCKCGKRFTSGLPKSAHDQGCDGHFREAHLIESQMKASKE